jgi:hypothetical protein
MTIVVAISVADGLVLASDSATTQQIGSSAGFVDTINIWNSANKIFNLRKSWPVGATTWGRADFLDRSVASHAKDFRELLTEGSAAVGPLDPLTYTIKEVADRAQIHFDALYAASPGGIFGLLIGGFGAGEDRPEVWQLDIEPGKSVLHQPLPSGGEGILQWGQPEAISRIVDGVSLRLGAALANLGVDATLVDSYVEAIKAQIGLPIVHAGMPLGEVIDLAEFLVDATIKFVRFTPGDAFVGGPIEVAALTKHEGFKWIKRKHYFSSALNP